MAAEFALAAGFKVRKKHRCSCMIFFLWLYLILFLVGCVILLLSVTQVQKDTISGLDNIHLPYPHYNRLSHSERRHFETFGWPYKQVNLSFDCSWLSETNNFEFLTSGWTKSVFKFTWQNESFALKTVSANGEEIRRCSTKDILENCYEQASSKLLKEFILLRELQHPNIAKVLGWCISEDRVALVMELCSPMNTMVLLRMSFQQRLKISTDLARLIYFLSSTPLGSVALNDFRRQQFVLCGDTLKVTDLDDVGIGEPTCRHQGDCTAGWCTAGLCKGHNDLQNVRHLFSQFLSLTLAFDTPRSLHLELTNLLLGPKQWDSFYVLKLIERISAKYCSDNKDCK